MGKTWFSVMWGADACRIDGPFGDDRNAAVEFVRTQLAHDQPHEAGGVFAVELEEITLEG